VEARYIDVISLRDIDMQNPAFKSIKDAEHQIYSLANISLPILDSSGKMLGTLQAESMYKLRKIGQATGAAQQKQIDTQIDKGVVKKKEYLGFSLIDEQVMIILTTLARMKMEQLIAIREKKAMEEEVIRTIELAGVVCT